MCILWMDLVTCLSAQYFKAIFLTQIYLIRQPSVPHRLCILKSVTFPNRLVKEVCDLQETMETLRSKIATAEGTHQTLLGVRAGLEADLRNKSTTLFIDRDQCMGLRRGYPVTAAIKA